MIGVFLIAVLTDRRGNDIANVGYNGYECAYGPVFDGRFNRTATGSPLNYSLSTGELRDLLEVVDYYRIDMDVWYWCYFLKKTIKKLKVKSSK